MIGIKMKLDKSKSYGEIMGATNGAKYEQNGNEFDVNGNLINQANDIIEPAQTFEIQPKKLGRPFNK
jgi:hypothetical protein